MVGRGAGPLPAALAGLLVLATGCAAGCAAAPRPRAEGPPPPPPPGVSVEVRLVGIFGLTAAPQMIWFARVASLNGSTCVPRSAVPEAAPGSQAGASDLGGADAGGRMALIGSLEGEGGFEGGDPTCMYDELGNPVWDPLLYRADRIEGARAYLDGPPPARYVAVAATFSRSGNSPNTVYFPADMIARTERPVPAGAAVDMGRYKVRAGGSFDPAQRFVRDRIKPLGPSRAAVALAFVAAVLANSGNADIPTHTAGRLVETDAPPAADLAPLPW